jgi:hypothetical protein
MESTNTALKASTNSPDAPPAHILGKASKGQIIFASLVLLGYLVASFLNLRAFPPYFFCDEAIVGVDAASMLHSGTDHRGRTWPIFFHGLGEYALALTVYLQIPFVALFGLDEVAVRARTACMSILGMTSTSYLFFILCGAARVWLVPAALVSAVFWYLHSRTGFEYIDATSCYMAAVASLLISISTKRRGWIITTGIFFGLCFYAYTPARGWAASLLGVLALLSLVDKRLSKGLLAQIIFVCAVILLPLVWLHYAHPEIAMQRFQAIRGERIYTLPFATVLSTTLENYLYALNPQYWFLNVEKLHPRHSLPGFSLIPPWMLALWLIGLANLVYGLRKLAHRIVLAMILTIPLTAAPFEISTARCLPLGVSYILLCALGADAILRKLPRFLSPLVGIALCAYAGWFVVYTQTKALYTYPFYGMYGIQYGARQLYSWVTERMKTDDDIRIINSTFNSGEALRAFFLPPDLRNRVRIIEPLHICQGREVWTDSTIFVFPALWFQTAPTDTCPPFEKEIVAVLNDPKGQPLFEALRIKRSPQLTAWWENKERERVKPQLDRLTFSGMDIEFEHPKIAWGTIEGLFDGDSGTRSRTDDINPGIFTVRFAATTIDEFGVRLDNTSTADVVAEVQRGSKWERVGERRYSRSRGDSAVLMFKNELAPVNGIRVTVQLPDGGPRASVHLADILLSKK